MSDLCNTGWLVLFSPWLADLKIKYFINLSILRSPLRPSVSNSVFTSALSSFLSLSPCLCTCTAESVLSSFGNYVCCLIETSCYGLLAVSLCDLLCAACTCSCVCVCVWECEMRSWQRLWTVCFTVGVVNRVCLCSEQEPIPDVCCCL